MPPSPSGEPLPEDGSLPADVLRRGEEDELGVYVHVPFCRVRCGYCDFNTYVPSDLLSAPLAASGPGRHEPAGTTPDTYVDALSKEIDLAVQVLGRAVRPLSTVFIGGGTPTLLPVHELVRIVDLLRRNFGFVDGVEITTEANPDTVNAGYLDTLAAGGFTRVSLGMQSSVPHVLQALDRTHRPENVARAVEAAAAAGMATSVDLIYGAPGESSDDWRRSLETAIALEPDHVSAYALVVETGTRLAAQVRRGELSAPDDDDEADKYELADDLLHAAGYSWYEVSNWARTPTGVCHHNLGYWRGGNWWGFGPGAHSHVGGMRWWNIRHPRSYAQRVNAGRSPAEAGERLTAEQRYDETVLLRSRLAEGLPSNMLRDEGRSAVAALIDDGLVEAGPFSGTLGEPRVVLTRRGRLLADTVVHRLL
ncbi:oxygen-independent coproporphyrinogen-3 oxidase [Austwickia chelonae]|uniref:Heme chaperone HemW n=1 Tax=Austwickia chelonae NBRC 105200 TaxID=1184607 RepID=K6VQE4_9MICO|nr:radical SAM family heme chaperone HemW [Austwickia chelonae]GAB77575.1 oxygen-independent coproporphyrinogen-III oxidase [Austwickia chelonae NBRC 105200]SEW13253.1 oxygen-independent coproporphyrinogen-3 oxidase [Austwickia chelonae]